MIGALRELSADPGGHGVLLSTRWAITSTSGPHSRSRRRRTWTGVTFASFATMSFGLPGFVSCTPGGIVRLLDEYGVAPARKRAVVSANTNASGNRPSRPVGG
jgi:methylenetetrahydrofolate dehydrogenase (NADP+)/methenyltetrahydrofolate cyclohydrolase